MKYIKCSNKSMQQRMELELSRSLLMSLKSISVALTGDRNIGCKAAMLESEPILAGIINNKYTNILDIICIYFFYFRQSSSPYYCPKMFIVLK